MITNISFSSHKKPKLNNLLQTGLQHPNQALGQISIVIYFWCTHVMTK